MNRRRWSLACIAGLIPTPFHLSAAMPTLLQTPPLQPRPLDPARRISKVRYASRMSGPTLVGLGAPADGQWPLWALTPQAGAQPLLRLSSPYGGPGCDLAGSTAGPAAVWSRPGSAISPLWTRVADQPPVELSALQPMGVYQGPRLVRGATAAGVTAVTEVDAQTRLALLLRRDTPQRILPAIGSGRLLAGQLVNHGARRWLFALCLPPGARLPERLDLLGESLSAGVLHAVPLDDSWGPAGPVQQPFGDDRLYEFDVDVVGPALVAIATSSQGWRWARGADAGGAGAWQAAPEAAVAEAPLTSPAVLADGAAVRIALLQAADGGASRLLLAQV